MSAKRRGSPSRCMIGLVLLFGLLVARSGWAQDVLDDDSVHDPWESLNRPIFILNEKLDQIILRPAAVGYATVTPRFAKIGVGNFVANLNDVNGALNALLQGRVSAAARNVSRFAINSTVGMFGLVDIATPAGIPRYRTDFGHTLARWGAGHGPFIMVPFFGPRTVRTGIGSGFDVVFSVQNAMESTRLRNSLFALEIVHGRAGLLEAEHLITGDRYIFLRDAYLQQRAQLEGDGVVRDSFSEFDDEDW